jgi:acetyl esterase
MEAIMPLDKSTIGFLERMESGPRLQDLTAEDSRAMFEQVCTTIGPKCTDKIDTVDLDIPGPGSSLHLRLYVPASGKGDRLPVLFYIHGGGFEMGSVSAYDGWCRFLASSSGYLTVSVDYRLIPEHPFPAAVDDTWAVLCWIREHVAEHGGDPGTIVVGGDSAGGNLAATLAMRSQADAKSAIAGQLLIYPSTDWSDEWPSMEEVAHGRMFLTRNSFRWTRERYLGKDADHADPFSSPLRAMDHSGKPPAIIITAEYDPLRDQGEAYGLKLMKAGVPVAMHRYNGHIHGFIHIAAVVPAGYDALGECGQWLRSLRESRLAAAPS